MTRGSAAAIVALALALAAGSVALVATSESVERPVLQGALFVAVGLAFVVAGVVAARRRPANRTGTIMVGAGLAWFLGALTASTNAFVFTVGVALGSLAYAFVVVLALGYPTGELRGRADRALAVAALGLATVGQVLFLLVAEPEHLCSDVEHCPDNLLRLIESDRASTVIRWSLNVLVAVLALALVARLAQRWREASHPLRRVLTLVLAATAIAFLAIVVRILVADLSGELTTATWLVQIAALIGVPIAFLLGLLRSRLARGSLTGLVVAIGRGEPLRDAIADALGDPTLRIGYWLDGRELYVDERGNTFEIERGPSRAATVVEREGRRVAVLVHDAALAEEAELLAGVTGAAGLGLEAERLQAELHAQFNFHLAIINTAPSLLLNVATDGRILNQNASALRASGLSSEDDLRGRFFWDVFIAPWERDAMKQRFVEAAPGFPPASYENTFTNAKGEVRVIAWEGAPVLDDAGAVVSIVAGGVDVTDRKERELELKRERDFSASVADTIPSFLVVTDHEAVIVGHAVNRAFKDVFGYAEDEEVLGQSFIGLVVTDDDHAARMAIANAANGVEQPELESRWLARDGSARIVSWSAKPLADEQGRDIVLITGADVTDRKRQEEEVRASRARIVQAADEARRRLERDLHDGAQQRLVSLALSLRLTEATITRDPDGAAAIIASSREELGLALDELRELARGIHPAILTDRGLGPALEALAARCPVPVELTPPARRLPSAVEAAAYYVAAEGLTNVAKYARAESVSVRVTEHGGWVVIEVTDDGVGGASHALGTGLRGLEDRLAALDGRLLVQSEPGAGTTLRAEMPLAGGTGANASIGASRDAPADPSYTQRS